MKKRLLSAFMALALCLTLLPAPAWAAEADAPEGGTIVQEEQQEKAPAAESPAVSEQAAGAVAEVDGTTYSDLIAAFDAAQEKPSATVKLLADVATNGLSSRTHRGTGTSAGNYIFEQGNVTFDLNGHTLTWTKYDVYSTSLVVGDNGRLTIRDSGTGGKIYNEETQALQIYAGTLNIQSGTVVSESNKALKIIGGDVSITGGTIHSGHYFGEGVSISPDTVNNRTATLTISGGAELKGGTNGSGLYVDHVGDENPLVKLSGGTYTGGSSGINCYNTTVGTLLDENCRYMLSGSEVTDTGVSTLGSGVTVEANPNAPVKYIDTDGNEARANCTEITAETWDISQGWHVVKENVTISGLNISGEVNLILCDGATLTVTSFMNVSAGSTLNLFWQSAGSGKLTAADISVLGTVTAPAGEMKQTNDSSGTTFEKCFEHDWEYTNNSDTHTATCKLCGKDGGAVNHSYTDWTDNSDGTHTGKCVCEATAKENHTPTYTPNADGLTHSTKCSKCGYTAAVESHNFNQTDDYGKKCACGAYLAAEYNGQQYATLARAIEAAKNGGTVTLQMDVGERITVNDGMNVTIDLNNNGWTTDGNTAHATLVVTGGSVTVQNGRLTSGTSSNAYTAVEVEGGKLTVGEDMTIQGGSMDADRQFLAIDVKGGELVLSVGAKLDGGLTMSGDARLKNKLTAGTFTNSGSETYSVSVEDSGQYTTVFDLLETGYAFAVYNEDALPGDVIAKDTTTRELTEDIAVIKCTHKDANNKSLFKDNTCTGCGFTCAHETVEKGVCTVCGAQMVAQDNIGKYYIDLAEAFEGVADGGTVTMLTTLKDDDTINFCRDAEGNPVEKTVTLMMNGHSLSYEGTSSLNIESGKLIIGDEATISQPAQAAQPAVFVDNTERSKDRGTLEFKGKANLTGGLLIQNWGKLVGGLKEGTIITSNSTYSVSVARSDTYGNVLGLLGDGLAFAKYDESAENKAGAIVDGSVKQLTEDVIVVAHKHSVGEDNKCACGFSCTHTNTEGASTIGKDGKCTACGTQFAAGIGETYYTDVPSALNAAADGQTVRLLANGMLPYGIYASKTLTLDLNGHSLSGYSLNVGGLTATSQARTGNLTVVDSSGGNGAVGVTVRDGGTLVFDPKNDSTTLLQLEVWGGTVELYGGKLLRKGLRLNNSITLGDLLPQKAGLAYYRGDTQLTLEEAASKTCDLVVKSCAHGGKNGFDESATACPYCNAPAVAETDLNDGKGGRLRRRFANLQTALDADRDGGATLQLLADVTGEYTIDGTRDTGFDLNGYCIKGTVTVEAATSNNTTTFSNTQNTTTANIDAVVAHKGAKLAGSRYPAVIGTLTLAAGATWKTILNDTALGYKVLNTDGTHRWYARDDVNGSQLNNVIIDRLPITSKTLNLNVDGKKLTGNPPKVERGTTVQLCASCNKGAEVTFSIKQDGKTTPITLTEPSYAGGKYTKDYSFDTIGEYTIYFTATKDGYTVQSTERKLTVTKPNLSNAEITFRSSNESTYEPYYSTTTAPGFTVTYNGKTLKLGVDYTASGTASSAGVSTQTLTIKAVEGSDYTGSKTAEWRIVPHKAKVEVGDVIKAYDGTTDLPDGKISLVSAAGSAGYQAGLPLPLSEGNGFELTDAKYDSANASETEKNISFTVKLTDTNYTFEDGTTEKAFTLNGAELDDKSFKINKAAAPTNIPTGTLSVINGTQQTYTYDFSKLLPELSEGEYGTINYGNQAAISLVSQSGYYYDETIVEFKNGVLILAQFYAKDGNMTGQIGTVKVKVTTTNYENFQLTLVLNAVDQIKPEPDGTITATPITYGDTLSKSEISGKMKDPNTGDAVNGTFTWTDGTIKPDANDRYEAEWTFTPAAGYEKYATATGTVTIKVNKAVPTFTAPTAQENLTYTGQEQALITADSVTSGGTMQYSLTENGTYSQDIPTGTVAGAYTVWYRVIGDENHNDTTPASVPVRIGQKPLTITGVTAVSKPYDGTTNAGITSVTFDGVTLNRGTDYTVAASFDDASVGNGKNVTATVTLMGQAAKNYALEQSSFPTTGSIIKAAAPDFTKETALTIVNGHEKTYTVTLPALPTLETPKEYGALTYEIGEIKLNDGYYTSGAKVENGELTLPIQKNDVETTGSVGTVTVVIKSANYEGITLTVNVSAKNRITPTGTPTLSKNAITYGDALNTIALSGKLYDNVNNVDVDGTFEWVDGTHIPVVGNGTYAAEWIFEPTDTEKYLTVSGRSNITVEKAQQCGKVSMAGYTYGQAPSTPTLTDRTGDANAQVTYRYSAADSGSVQTWDISNPPALNAGTYRMYASIGDTDNYYGFEAVYCEFVVAKATPTYTVPTGLTAKYGQTLADVTLPDGWSWMDSSESVGGASTAAKTFQAKFTPKDTENYNMVENIELEVMVNKADQAALTIQGADSVVYGQALTLTTTGGSGMGAVTCRIDTAYSTGEATIDPNTGVLTPVKVGSVSVIATKVGDNDYNDVTSAPFVLMIKPATSTGEPKYTKITTSGKTLKDAALTTEGSTLKPNGGKLEWVDDKDNVLSGDTKVEANTTYKWRFTPTDTNYTTLTGEIELYRKSSSGGGGWYYSYYTIKATAGSGGSISPSGDVSVREGGDQTFTITPDKGYAVANVKIDGKRIGAVKSYTFENVRRTHTIEVIFVKGTASASTGDSSNLPLWSALLLASTLTLAGAVRYKRKRAR